MDRGVCAVPGAVNSRRHLCPYSQVLAVILLDVFYIRVTDVQLLLLSQRNFSAGHGSRSSTFPSMQASTASLPGYSACISCCTAVPEAWDALLRAEQQLLLVADMSKDGLR
jgi:hypothetical protein